jgi:hypothetical protein
MNETEIKNLVEQYKSTILENNGENAERYLMMLCREIERITRHKAVSIAYDLAEKINIMNK